MWAADRLAAAEGAVVTVARWLAEAPHGRPSLKLPSKWRAVPTGWSRQYVVFNEMMMASAARWCRCGTTVVGTASG